MRASRGVAAPAFPASSLSCYGKLFLVHWAAWPRRSPARWGNRPADRAPQDAGRRLVAAPRCAAAPLPHSTTRASASIGADPTGYACCTGKGPRSPHPQGFSAQTRGRHRKRIEGPHLPVELAGVARPIELGFRLLDLVRVGDPGLLLWLRPQRTGLNQLERSDDASRAERCELVVQRGCTCRRQRLGWPPEDTQDRYPGRLPCA